MTLIAQLHQDHINLSRLLELMELKIQKLKAGDAPNFMLLSELVDYIGNYADQYHHPREDHMYHYFAGQSSALDEHLQQCEAEHADLKQASKTVNETVDAVMHDAVIPMSDFIDQLEAFVLRERDHLDYEETVIFPGIEKIAKTSDWEVLEQKLPEPEDPLFGEKQGENYRELYKALLQDVIAAR
ncbi:hemerythrin domain-containing protein [Nitrincola sp.]|uniref:hemerythrin domain-containing protein n=1 Tax=Nitrincola sp. TaxID=1926584 RepID=UPI003A919E4A